MKICSNHSEYPVPLIFTFAFRGCEWWCPFCGNRGGFLGTGDNAEETPELTARLEAYEKKADEFLRAFGRQNCVETKHEGKWVKPGDLPEDVKRKDAELRESWVYGQAV
jgi:hypothetical protein